MFSDDNAFFLGIVHFNYELDDKCIRLKIIKVVLAKYLLQSWVVFRSSHMEKLTKYSKKDENNYATPIFDFKVYLL